MLRQLSKDELLQIAKNKRAKIKEALPKSKMVELLTPFVTRKDIDEILSKHGRRGQKALIDGMLFERKVMKRFTAQGYKCELSDVSIRGMEFDIIGEKTEGTLIRKTYYIIAECKNKPNVTMQDFDKFLGKYNHFVRRKGVRNVEGYLITSGIFEPAVKSAARTHPEIRLVRIKART